MGCSVKLLLIIWVWSNLFDWGLYEEVYLIKERGLWCGVCCFAIYLSEIELRDLVIVIYDRPIGLYYEFRLETITCRLVCCSLVSSFLVWKIKMRISIARDWSRQFYCGGSEAEWLPELIQWWLDEVHLIFGRRLAIVWLLCVATVDCDECHLTVMGGEYLLSMIC